jgi:hypothetical protein
MRRDAFLDTKSAMDYRPAKGLLRTIVYTASKTPRPLIESRAEAVRFSHCPMLQVDPKRILGGISFQQSYPQSSFHDLYWEVGLWNLVGR